MSSEKRAYLIAGGRPLSPAAMVSALAAALRECGVKKPRVAYVGAASQDSWAFYQSMKMMLVKAGAGEVEMLKLAGKHPEPLEAAEYLKSADAVFISGGEVEDGMEVLARFGIDSLMRDLFANGTLFFGVSAGSIMMGDHWVRWRDPDDDDTAELFDCLGLVPATFDTHAEDEDWKELKACLRLMGPGAKGYGIPGGGMISGDSSGHLVNHEKELLCYENVNGHIQRAECGNISAGGTD